MLYCGLHHPAPPDGKGQSPRLRRSSVVLKQGREVSRGDRRHDKGDWNVSANACDGYPIFPQHLGQPLKPLVGAQSCTKSRIVLNSQKIVLKCQDRDHVGDASWGGR